MIVRRQDVYPYMTQKDLDSEKRYTRICRQLTKRGCEMEIKKRIIGLAFERYIVGMPKEWGQRDD